MRTVSPIPWLAIAMLANAAHATDPEPPVSATPRTEKVCIMGLNTSAMTPLVREQLGLPVGVGVAVDAVDPDGPAQIAGVAQHDIITRLDDQLIVNIEQLSVLVRLHHAGEVVKLGITRHGKPLTLNVTLAERNLPVAEDLALRMGAPHGGHVASMVTQTDGTHVITLTTHGDDDRHVHITDIAGRLIYDGPMNTPEEEAMIPEECRGKVEQIEKNLERFKLLRGMVTPPPVNAK